MARLMMSDAEWAFFDPFIHSIRGRGGRPAGDHRLVLDGIFWIARTGAQWRDLPEEFGKWSSVYRQFRRWCQWQLKFPQKGQVKIPQFGVSVVSRIYDFILPFRVLEVGPCALAEVAE